MYSIELEQCHIILQKKLNGNLFFKAFIQEKTKIYNQITTGKTQRLELGTLQASVNLKFYYEHYFRNLMNLM